MFRFAGFLMAVSLTISMFAMPPLRDGARPRYGAPARVVRAESSETPAARLRRIGGNVASELPDSAFVIAVVGNTAGGGGTYFRSDVMVINNRQVPQTIDFFYLPAGAGCNAIRLESYTFPANYWYSWSDFVADVFETSGLGSVVAFAVDAFDNVDPNANIDGFSRIWTPVPGFRGTASQSFPPVTLSDYPWGQLALGLRNDADFRTNLAILNYLPDSPGATRVFDVWVGGGTGLTQEYTVSVPPCSLVLQAIPSGNYGPLIIDAEPRDSFGGWYGFGSTVDNHSGDNWSSSMRPY